MVLILGVLLLCAPLLAAQTSFPINGDRVETVKGRGLLVRTKPAGARVYIDGIERGQTPLELPDLRSACYSIRVSKSGYEERELRVHVSGEGRLELDLELWALAGRILLTVRAEAESAFSVPARRPDLFIDGSAPLEDRALEGIRFGNAGRFPAPGIPPRIPGGQVYLVSAGSRLAAVVPVSASQWVYDLYVPIGLRRIRVRAFGRREARTTLTVESGKTLTVTLDLPPAAFHLSPGRLSRAAFNPANTGTLGSTGLSFEVSAPGRGLFSVLDREGRLIYSRELTPFTTWSQEAVWDGRNQEGEIQEDGPYTLQVEAYPSTGPAGKPEAPQRFSRQVLIDSSLVIYPLTLFAAMPGLFYTPSPALLPPGAFQTEFSLLFGQTPMDRDAAAPGGIPVELAFRYSPLKNLELAGAVDLFFAGDNTSPWGFSLSLKRPFTGSGEKAGIALLGAFSWAQDMKKSPQREGASLIVPMSFDVAGGLSLLLAPGVFWSAWERPEPRPLLSLGSLYRRGMVSAEISLRGELDISRAVKGGPPLDLFSSAGVTLNPPPSNLVFGLAGGLWNRTPGPAVFGVFSLGLIF
ncbi:MAG: PEGA domain-containing protein [Treponema sp.]|nr:PEGA domain-containing protein [Treponema sp.]